MWNGSTWSLIPSPNASGSTSDGLYGVSCTATDFCMALGSSDVASFIERWNGASWSIVADLSVGQDLTSISCVGQSFCMAVGSTPASTSLAVAWTGGPGTLSPAPRTPQGGS